MALFYELKAEREKLNRAAAQLALDRKKFQAEKDSFTQQAKAIVRLHDAERVKIRTMKFTAAENLRKMAEAMRKDYDDS